jgi:hypothetical protein
VLDAIGHACVGAVDEAIVPLIVGVKRLVLREETQEVAGEQERLHLGEWRNGAESGANEADESDCWVVALPDLAYVRIVSRRVGATTLIV